MTTTWNQKCRCGSQMARIAHSSNFDIEVYQCRGDCLAWLAVLYVTGGGVRWYKDPRQDIY